MSRVTERSWLRGMPIQLLLWTTVPAILILIVVAVVGVVGHQEAMQDLVLARDARLAQSAAGRLSDRLEMTANQLQTLAGEVQSSRPNAEDDSLADHPTLTQAFDQGIAIVSPQDQIAASLPHNRDWAPLRPTLQSLLSSPDTSSVRLSPAVRDPVTGERLLLLAVPAGENWLVGSVSFQRLGLESLVADVSLGKQGYAFVIDGTGKVLIASATAPDFDSLDGQPGVVSALRGEAGATIAPIDGTDIAQRSRAVIGYAPVPSVGWGLITQEPWDAVVGPMMRFSLVVPLILAIAAVAALISIVFGLRSIARPLQQLDEQAARLAWGDFEAVQAPVGGTQEIEDLRRTLNDLAQQIRAYQQGMRDYIGAITRGQEEERKRLARELHDDTVQDLIALGHRVEMARRALDHDPEAAAQRLDELKALVGDTLAEVRRFTRALRPIYLEDLGLLPALEMLVRDIETTTNVASEFEVSGAARRLSGELELAVYRIAQEALSNVVQHAQATRVTVRLRFTDDEVTLTVEDNGIGFDVPERPEGLARAGHFGLLGMQERAALVGGRLTLESEASPRAPERGDGHYTRVTASLPISPVPSVHP